MGLPPTGAMNLGVCAELLQSPGFIKFLLGLQYVLGSGDMHIDLLCQAAAPAKHKYPEVGNLMECFAAFSGTFSVTTSVGQSLPLPIHAGGLLTYDEFHTIL